MRVDLFDTEGNRYSISFEGQVTRDKAVRLLDIVELLGGMPGGDNSGASAAAASNALSKYDKLRVLVQRQFPVVWFSSREVQSAYEQEFKEPMSLSTVSTYLSRMSTKGVVQRSGPPNSLRFKSGQGPPQVLMRERAT